MRAQPLPRPSIQVAWSGAPDKNGEWKVRQVQLRQDREEVIQITSSIARGTPSGPVDARKVTAGMGSHEPGVLAMGLEYFAWSRRHELAALPQGGAAMHTDHRRWWNPSDPAARLGPDSYRIRFEQDGVRGAIEGVTSLAPLPVQAVLHSAKDVSESMRWAMRRTRR